MHRLYYTVQIESTHSCDAVQVYCPWKKVPDVVGLMVPSASHALRSLSSFTWIRTAGPCPHLRQQRRQQRSYAAYRAAVICGAHIQAGALQPG